MKSCLSLFTQRQKASVLLSLRNIPTRHHSEKSTDFTSSWREIRKTNAHDWNALQSILRRFVLRQVERYLTPISLNLFLPACLDFFEAALFFPSELQHGLPLCHQDCCISLCVKRSVRTETRNINESCFFHFLSACSVTRQFLCICSHTNTSSPHFIKASETRQLFWLNFVIMMYNLVKQCNIGWKMTSFAAKLVSNKPCFYHDIVFANRMRQVSRKHEKSLTLSVYAALLSARWHSDLISSPCSDSPLPTTECLQITTSFSSSSSWDGAVYCAATFPATVSSQFKLDLEKKSVNKRNKAWAGTNDLLPNGSHATANVSLVAW